MMVDSVNSLANNPIYQAHYALYQKMKAQRGGDLTFPQYLTLLNVDASSVIQGFENVIETGDYSKGDGVAGNTLSHDRFVIGNNGSSKEIYQTQDQDGYYDIDWETGNYEYINTQDVAGRLGLDTENYNYDTIIFGRGKAEITDFTFGGLDDGQNREEYNINGAYSGISYAVQEFDPCYILDQSLQDPSDPEYQKALKNWEYLSSTADQWMSDADFAKLEGLDPSSVEYKQALIDIILDKLDQVKSFSDHAHVENKPPVTAPDDTTNGDNSTGDGDDSSVNQVPNYDRNEVMNNTSIYGDYVAGATRVTDQRTDDIPAIMSEATEKVRADLNEAANALRKQLGDGLTAEMDAYINKAILQTIDYMVNNSQGFHASDGDYNRNTDTIDTGRRKNSHDRRASYNIKNAVNRFFSTFDQLCASGGKSQAQVDAENAQKEKLKGEYKSFYDFNVKSLDVTDSNVKSEYTVSMTGGNYKQDAKDKVLTPYANKLTSTIKGKCPNLTEAQIKSIVDSALTSTLTKSGWVEANGNISTGGTYTINTDKLLDEFNAQIKAAIKASGAYNPEA